MNTTSPSTSHDARGLNQRLQRRCWRMFKQARQSLLPQRVRQHVLVAGMQRSGTNLLMDVLDASRMTQVFHETDPRAFNRYEMRERAHIRQLAATCPAPVFVIKALCELDQLPSLMQDLSPAQTLWIVRDWRNSVSSAIRSFGNFVAQWGRLIHGYASKDWRGRGMSDATRNILRALYRPEASETDGAAIMWYYRNMLFFEQGLERDPRVKLIFYEELVEDPMQQVATIYAFLGLRGFNSRIARRIHSHSIQRRMPPGISPGVAELCNKLYIRFAATRNAQGE